ncbi:MAG TPA: condensation domain-containing protein, partial [Terriglobales bacterium]
LAADPSLYNFDGPTETTVWSTFHRFRSVEEGVTVGRPLANTRIYILDAQRQPVPIGVAGELYIGGDGVARGYLNRPELTAEKFVPDPFSGSPADRLYRTGDLARYLADGRIDFLGRADNQVKVRGYRIELGEIETVVASHKSVQQAVVVVREDRPGDKRLVAYVVPGQGISPDLAELREWARNKLPEYMVPSKFAVLQKLPLSPNGKVDRKALPDPGAHPEAEQAGLAPRTPAEEVIATIWEQVLRIKQVGIQDNFFSLGGHSLLATQVISRIRQVFQVEVPLRLIFEAPTVAGQAAAVERGLKAEQRIENPPLTKADRGKKLPLSFAQQRLWFMDQLDPNKPLYNIPRAFRLTGALDVKALERSLNEVVRRHESLRTTFSTEDNEPIQVIAPTLNVELPITDLSQLSPETRETEAQRLMAEEGFRPFDLAQGPVFRTSLLRLSERDHILLLNVHHIVSDRWSIDVFTHEFTSAYKAFITGETCSLPELPLQYADFAVWQRQWVQGEVLRKQLEYWTAQFDGTLQVLDL